MQHRYLFTFVVVVVVVRALNCILLQGPRRNLSIAKLINSHNGDSEMRVMSLYCLSLYCGHSLLLRWIRPPASSDVEFNHIERTAGAKG